MKTLIQAASSRHIVINALRVSAVVGTLVNLINQGGDVLQGQAPSWIHLGLNYLMPYLVASYSAAKNEVATRRAAGGGSAPQDRADQGPGVVAHGGDVGRGGAARG